MKKRGFGMGKWNGFGGKALPGENIFDAAKREMNEEAGIVVNDLERVGRIDFEFENNPEILEVHVFDIKSFSGEPTESEEMRPEWFEISQIPYDNMWADDPFWYPLFLSGKKFQGWCQFNEAGDKVLEQNIIEVKSLVVPGIYEHYKKHNYEVVTVVVHSETFESHVVYIHLDNGSLWVRPLTMFAEEVEVNGQKVPRFRYLGEKE